MRQDFTQKLLKLYHTEDNFLKVFSPSLQSSVLFNEVRAYTGSAPTLNVVKLGFGQNIAETWLMAQFEDLNTFCGVKEKANIHQITELARLIISAFWYLKISEFLLFFGKFKLGQYGKFYGVIDPMIITNAMYDFLNERKVELIRIKKEQDDINAELKRIELDKKVMSKEEFEETEWLFKM